MAENIQIMSPLIAPRSITCLPGRESCKTAYMTFLAKQPPLLCVILILLVNQLALGSADVSSHGLSSADRDPSRIKRIPSGHGVVVMSSDAGSEQIFCNATFQPEELTVNEKQLMTVNYSMTCQPLYSNLTLVGLRLQFKVKDVSVAVIQGKHDVNYSQAYSNGHSDSPPALHTVLVDGNYDVMGVSFGKTVVEMQVVPVLQAGHVVPDPQVIQYRLLVLKVNTVISIVYLAVLGVMIVIYNFGFGCKIEWQLIVAIMKKPVAPAIGFCCQFLVMAPLSFGIAQALDLSNEAGLGLLAIGASPGGGGSNVFSYLLQGDLELSITMSFISTVASLGMTPFWIWALGRFFTGGSSKIEIPITSVFSSLAVVTIPVVIGLIVSRFKPQVAKKIAWCLKPFTAIIGMVFLGLGVYVYYPALTKVTWRTLVACLIVPIAGYIIGASVGKLCRQVRRRWITISLETGFQNLALSLLIIGTSLDPPESDLAGVVPICYTFLSAAIPSLIFIGRFFYLIHKGDKPWKKTETLDLSPLHDPSASPPSEYDSPIKGRSSELPLDNSGVTCTVSYVLDRYDLTRNHDTGSPVNVAPQAQDLSSPLSDLASPVNTKMTTNGPVPPPNNNITANGTASPDSKLSDISEMQANGTVFNENLRL